MNVYKRDKSGPYWYRFNYQNRQIRRSSGVYDKQDAKDIASAYRTQLVKGEVGLEKAKPKAIPCFTQAMKDFLEWSEQEHAARPSSHLRYVTSSKPLLRYFGTNPLDQISSDEVEKYKTWRAKQKKAPAGKRSARPAKATKRLRPATVNRELACLKHLFSRNDGLIPRNPVSKVKFLAEDNEQIRVVTRDEENLYLMAASQPLQDIARLMVETGARPEEVCRIRRENVHIEQSYLFVPFGKTKAARRRIPLNDLASAVLSRRLESIEGEYLFPGRVESKPIVKVNAAHTSAIKRSKVKPFTLYSLRHTWATRATESGVDLVTLAAMLGHSKIAMVLRYAHPTQEHQFAAMRKMQATAAR
jgi:integrase